MKLASGWQNQSLIKLRAFIIPSNRGNIWWITTYTLSNYIYGLTRTLYLQEQDFIATLECYTRAYTYTTHFSLVASQHTLFSLALSYVALPPLIYHVRECSKKNEARLQLLEKEFAGISQGTLRINQYFTKVKNIFWDISQLDPEEEVNVAQMRRLINNCLRPEYVVFMDAVSGWPTQPSLVELQRVAVGNGQLQNYSIARLLCAWSDMV